jgi:hypothetical protein
MKKPKPPAEMTPEARSLWNKTLANWPVGGEETLLTCLRSACGALTRLRAAEEAIGKLPDGGIFNDRWGQPRAHPLFNVIRDTSKQLREDLKMLCLDWEVLNRGKDEDDRNLEIPELEEERSNARKVAPASSA